ncbi:MAG: histidine kinase [Spirochaetes bacterium GWB1_48_6]|nr:MAG: histidine kinase [Spirochaetes bacterium GWB1_48_6]
MDQDEYILIVEDEDSIRLTLRDYLSRLGFRVVVASDGVGAIKQILDYKIKLIITDYRMDILGGDYWVRFLNEFCKDKKVLLTSGFLKPEFPVPFELIMKPYSFKDLEVRVQELMGV